MSTRSRLTVSCVLATVAALGIRVWWVWPRQLPGGPLLEAIEEHASDYLLKPKTGVGLSKLVDLSVLHGYTPAAHSEYEKKIDDNPSKYVEKRSRHNYVEYVVPGGRMEFHCSYEENEYAAEWMEFVPTQLPVDHFFDATIAVAFDLSRERFIVYIAQEGGRTDMTVYVRHRLIERIVWLDR